MIHGFVTPFHGDLPIPIRRETVISPTSEHHHAVMNPGRVLLFALACGLSVANLYYAQPLLPQIAVSFGVKIGQTANIVTAAQIGYILGLALLVPLGDMLVRRRLIPGVIGVAVVALVAAAAAPNLLMLELAVVLAGTCSVAAQILVPFAASLAEPQRQGRVVGTVMSGLLLGILLARSFSGIVAQAAGWRTVYAGAAGAMALLGVLLAFNLPNEKDRPSVRYRDLLASVIHLVRAEPVLQVRSILGALIFATFSVIWTGLSFLLTGPPYEFGSATIGLFGLLGVAGALAATFSGHLADRGWERHVTGGGLVLLLASTGLLAVGSHRLWALMAGVVLGDLAIQSVHIQNQHLIFAIDPAARSRLNTAYMVFYFIGGAIGSASCGLAWSLGGWSTVVILMAFYATSALVVWMASDVVHRRQRHFSR